MQFSSSKPAQSLGRNKIMGPKSIRFRIPTLTRPLSPPTEYDIDEFVEKVPTIVVSQHEEENELVIDSLEDFVLHAVDGEKVIEQFHKVLEEDKKAKAAKEEVLLAVPIRSDKFPDEFATFVQQCQRLMDEVDRIKKREPIQDFLDKYPVRDNPPPPPEPKKKRRRKKTRYEKFLARNQVKKFKYDKNVKYHLRSCSKSLNIIKESLELYSKNSVTVLYGADEQEMIPIVREKSKLQDVFKRYLKLQQKDLKKRCKLIIAPDINSKSIQLPTLVESSDQISSDRDDHDSRTDPHPPRAPSSLALHGTRVRGKKILVKESSGLELESVDDTPEEEVKTVKDVLEMHPTSLKPLSRKSKARSGDSFRSVAILQNSNIVGEFQRAQSELNHPCQCKKKSLLEEEVRRWNRRKEKQTKVKIVLPPLSQKAGLDLIKSLMIDPFKEMVVQ